MAEPYDFLLAKYIEIGKSNLSNPNFDSLPAIFDARQATVDNFGNAYTDEEYDSAMDQARLNIIENYSDNFARVPD